jgi:predicted PurR-regulated permease PerM
MYTRNRFITFLTLLFFTFSEISPLLFVGVSSLEQVSAYTENSSNTFAYYQQELISIKQDIESEYRKNNTVSAGLLQNARNLIQSAYDRLPDIPKEYATANSEAKK